MSRVWLVVAIAVMAPAVSAVALPLPRGTYQVIVPPKSCQSWFSDCASRCRGAVPNNPNCIPTTCVPRLAACRQSGCWQDPKGLHCDLAR